MILSPLIYIILLTTTPMRDMGLFALETRLTQKLCQKVWIEADMEQI